MQSFNYTDLGLVKYEEAWNFQHQLVDAVATGIKSNEIILCEHPHVYTFGKRAEQDNFLISDAYLKTIEAEKFQVERGGDITYHGPGQLVGYPILDLHKLKIGVKTYVHKLEEAVIQTLAAFEINCMRIDGLTGIWLQDGISRKIGAIGIKVSRGITMHGFALNVNTNLDYFKHIIPCGIADKGVTSMQHEIGRTMDMNQVKDCFKYNFEKLFSQVSSAV